MEQHTPRYDTCGYLDCVLENSSRSWRVESAVYILKKYEFEALAFRGMSGALIAPILSHLMDKSLLMVRKPEDGGHHGRSGKVEGDKAASRYVIVDDFFSSGFTAASIYWAVKKFAPQAECIGCLGMRDLPRVSELNFFPGRFSLRPLEQRWLKSWPEDFTLHPERYERVFDDTEKMWIPRLKEPQRWQSQL